ncbi:MAG TPA: HyaD/HybD family hydrogenase maturation endopeptidase [Acidobacteriaceae bacterium]|jgi:hydrogenase maturation protease
MSGIHIVVLGLGNLMRTDDAVGMLAVEQLRADVRLPASVSLVDGGTLGLDLLYPLEGATHLLALDAVDTGAAPGTLLRFEEEQIAELPISKSVHLLGFSDLIGAMHLTGSTPAEIVVLGVQPEATGWGTQLTSRVEGALPELIASAIAQVERWRGEMPALPPAGYTDRAQACAAG